MTFFASPELGFTWCLAVSHPWPRSCIFAIVQARLRHDRGFQRCCFGPAECTVFCLAWARIYRWCLAVSDPLPKGCRFAFVQARLRHVFLSTYWGSLLLLYSSLGVPKVPLRPPANDRFLPRLSSDLGGVWLFRIHCQKAAVLRLSRLGCATFFAYVLGLSSSPLFFFRGSKGATSAPCEWPFSASPELGFKWCLAVSDPFPKGCRFAFVQARLRHVFCLRTGALFFSFRGSKGATSATCEWPFFCLAWARI